MSISDKELDFDEKAYLDRYPDVARAVKSGSVPNGKSHYLAHGIREGRFGGSTRNRLWNLGGANKNCLGNNLNTMQIRTISNLNALLIRQIPRFTDIDLIVGIPRSGLLVANILALHLNKPLLSFSSFLNYNLADMQYTHRKVNEHSTKIKPKVLIIDDSFGTGKTFNKVDQQLQASKIIDRFNISKCAVYYGTNKPNDIIGLESLEHPRIFEWNIINHDYTRQFCFDLDGILCVDPSVNENDDGPAYENFLKTAPSYFSPSRPLGAIVTSRLEKYRAPTVAWLAKKNIRYDHLIMLDLPSGAERRRLKIHAQFKSEVYIFLGGYLFIESDINQAKEIFNITRKSVWCPRESRHFTYL